MNYTKQQRVQEDCRKKKQIEGIEGWENSLASPVKNKESKI